MLNLMPRFRSPAATPLSLLHRSGSYDELVPASPDDPHIDRPLSALPSPAARVAALRQLGERFQGSSDSAYRAYQARLVDYNCDFAARLHNATTPAQRQKARDRIKGYEDDLRWLVDNAPARAGAPQALTSPPAAPPSRGGG